MRTVRKVTANHKKRVTTGEINRFFEQVLAHHPPPDQRRPRGEALLRDAGAHRPAHVHGLDQPPRARSHQLPALLINQIRERFDFAGTPIRVHYRGRKKDEED